MDLLQRKQNRIPAFNYSETGAYFIPVCTHERKKLLSEILVGTAVPGCPQETVFVRLLPYGIVADRYIRQMNAFYDVLSVDKYVIMPDHIHFLITVHGQPGTAVPAKDNNRNASIARFVGSLKRFCNKEYGKNIWQRSYYDHVVRNQQDYDEIWQYIENNPRKWAMVKQNM